MRIQLRLYSCELWRNTLRCHYFDLWFPVLCRIKHDICLIFKRYMSRFLCIILDMCIVGRTRSRSLSIIVYFFEGERITSPRTVSKWSWIHGPNIARYRFQLRYEYEIVACFLFRSLSLFILLYLLQFCYCCEHNESVSGTNEQQCSDAKKNTYSNSDTQDHWHSQLTSVSVNRKMPYIHTTQQWSFWWSRWLQFHLLLTI